MKENRYYTKDEMDQMQTKENNNLVFAVKIIFVVALTLFLLRVIIKYNKTERKNVPYIGNSIMKTPNLMPENCSVGQMEYYEHLSEVK
jgi:hypothetical protein